MNWTKGQQAAIDAQNPTVLVSAAAGSGKTAVLVSRVTRLIKEGGDISRMLIVTFTRAAAAEMRERIGKALDKETGERMARQQMRVARAQISTIHGFCQHVIKQHFEVLGIDPMTHLGDSAKLNSLLTRAAQEAMEEAYETPTDDQTVLFSTYSPEDVQQMALSIRKFVLSLAEPWEWAEKQRQPYHGDLADHPCFELLLNEVLLRLQKADAMLNQMSALFNDPCAPVRYQKTLQQDAALLSGLQAQAHMKTLRAIVPEFPRLAGGKAQEGEDPEIAKEYKTMRDAFKDSVKATLSLLPSDDETALRELNESLPCIRGLCALTKAIDTRYSELKAARTVMDYGDMEHFCYTILKNESVRMDVARQYDAIFIDEYQDVSGIEEAIISSLHQGNSLFLVGDVKQSIYRFRLADPTLFLQKYETFSQDADAPERKILLQQNFRSDENILSAVNQVFLGAMRKRVTEIDYDQDAMLYPGGNTGEGEDVELDLILKSDLSRDEPENDTEQDEQDEQEELTGIEYETLLAAQRIRELKKTMRITENGVLRPVRNRDIVILMRAANKFGAQVAEKLQALDIPVYSDADNQYYEMPEVADIINLLRVLDNPMQDLPLIAALRCPCFSFTAEELAQARIAKEGKIPFYEAFGALCDEDSPLGEKARSAKETLTRWLFMKRHLDPESLVRLLLTETGTMMMAGAMPGGEARQANLRLLCEKAQAASNLHEFLETADKTRSIDDAKTAKTLSDSEDVVRIMTMHKSKGLEFPVVILMGLGSDFTQKKRPGVRTDTEYGMAMDHIDLEKRVLNATFAADALDIKHGRDGRAEEARLLYVAMTRAKNKLIMISKPSKPDSALKRWSLPAGDVAAGSACTMLDWIAQAILPGVASRGEDTKYTAPNGSRWDIRWFNTDSLPLSAAEDHAAPPVIETGDISPLVSGLMDRVNPPLLPLKVSVSAVTKAIIEEQDLEQTIPEKRVSRETISDRPRFMQEKRMTGAERGTLVHKVLSLIPYDAVRGKCGDALLRAIRQSLDGMCAQQVITAVLKNEVPVQDIAAFFESEIGRRALHAPAVRREWDFNLRIEKNTIVQGVIDLCFREGDAWVLVDYKTDRVEKVEDLADRYGDQIRWYARALRELTRVPVKEAMLYSIPLKQQIKIEGSK